MFRSYVLYLHGVLRAFTLNFFLAQSLFSIDQTRIFIIVVFQLV
jgi:hypothetical protein